MNIITPSKKQIENCEGFGYEYIGLGLFTRGDFVGFFTTTGWHKILEEDFK